MFAPKIPGRAVLATDLDGTLIPLYRNACSDSGHDAKSAKDAQLQALEHLRLMVEEKKLEIVFVTGRHQSSAIEVIKQESLPTPQWIICDVGTTLLRRDSLRGYSIDLQYVNHLKEVTQGLGAQSLSSRMTLFNDLILQEPEKQGEYKLSFYCSKESAEPLAVVVSEKLEEWEVPYEVTWSIDVDEPRGMIDLLPKSIHKGYAVSWWARLAGYSADEIIYAGDSGNDLAAFKSGFHSIVVANASETVVSEARAHHRETGTLHRLHCATKPGTQGVLEGVQQFLGIRR